MEINKQLPSLNFGTSYICVIIAFIVWQFSQFSFNLCVAISQCDNLDSCPSYQVKQNKTTLP
jgi:hypothetical protein